MEKTDKKSYHLDCGGDVYIIYAGRLKRINDWIGCKKCKKEFGDEKFLEELTKAEWSEKYAEQHSKNLK